MTAAADGGRGWAGARAWDLMLSLISGWSCGAAARTGAER